jgi:hypothetical protein
MDNLVQPGGPALFAQLAARRLNWLPQLGIGFLPIDAGNAPYDRDYFDRFARDAATPLGRQLMAARCDLVDRHWRGLVVDVGIGAGAFIEARNRRRRQTMGWDVNPAGLEWLQARGLLMDPHCTPVDAIALWDVLEHIADFRSLLANVRQWVFTSLPIFSDHEHALRSKHFRPTEHYWYFTQAGLINLMQSLGFAVVEVNQDETDLGREDIVSFAFRRIDACRA